MSTKGCVPEKKVESWKMDPAVKPIFARKTDPVTAKVRGMHDGDVAAASLLAFAGLPFEIQVSLLREYRDREPRRCSSRRSTIRHRAATDKKGKNSMIMRMGSIFRPVIMGSPPLILKATGRRPSWPPHAGSLGTS